MRLLDDGILDMPPTNITLPQAERVKEKGSQESCSDTCGRSPSPAAHYERTHTVIAHKTFSGHRGIRPKGMLRNQAAVREEAQAFIADTLQDEDVISVTESAIVSTMSKSLVSVTVWYRVRAKD